MQFLTTKEWATLQGVAIRQVDSWITNGHVRYERRAGKRMIAADHPLPDLFPPEGFVTIPEYSCVHGVPKYVLHDLIKRGVIPIKQSASSSKRWISLDVKLERDNAGWRVAS